MFEENITSKELKFNDLGKKVYCFIGCLIIKLVLESYDRKIMQSRNKEKYRHKGLRETEKIIERTEEIHRLHKTIDDMAKQRKSVTKS